MRNVLMTLAYDGAGFHGWQKQPGQRTVQGVLEAALSRVCGEQIRLHGTSRTDAGVHAFGQRASFSGDFGIPAARIPVAANNLLADVRVMDARDVPEGFHARYDAVGKTYLYRIACAREPDIFQRNYQYQLKEKPNVGKIETAAHAILGTHDFACFQTAGGTPRETTVRTIYGIQVAEKSLPDGLGRLPGTAPAGNSPPAAGNSWADGLFQDNRPRECRGQLGNGTEEIEIEVSGDGFLYNMVRILTGTLVEVGLGMRDAAEIPGILASKDRRRAGHTAPAHGLYLKNVFFDEQF
jgi:tRNA pseudouridine38-40 synthase